MQQSGLTKLCSFSLIGPWHVGLPLCILDSFDLEFVVFFIEFKIRLKQRFHSYRKIMHFYSSQHDKRPLVAPYRICFIYLLLSWNLFSIVSLIGKLLSNYLLLFQKTLGLKKFCLWDIYPFSFWLSLTLCSMSFNSFREPITKLFPLISNKLSS